ncbi:MAG: hypothetical protein IT168_27135 [Bryobacterales bacterium]|nr:hypothetical protein [Bryobacterales bacterium]
MGPDLATRMDDPQRGVVYPGKLHIYDVETEKLFPLTTNQADTEVLLVQNGFVYYRVLNELYSAPISNEGLGHPSLLATDDAILDAHWAFIKPWPSWPSGKSGMGPVWGRQGRSWKSGMVTVSQPAESNPRRAPLPLSPSYCRQCRP